MAPIVHVFKEITKKIVSLKIDRKRIRGPELIISGEVKELEEARISSFAPDTWVDGDDIHLTDYTKGKGYGEKDSFRFGDVK